ncbi:MAG: o-succinylbenzoate synthase [Acidobacteria bacterium RIFCSPLOWO2_12_FULL_54_10]|nr:MAG: o-succinylbenzoate synthase [Acidobacteria bacterium RIFCSPLOWO2_12_FULL_54_10]
MKIDQIILREIRMPLVAPFETSFGATTQRRIVLVEVKGEGNSGWGEVTAGETPFYNEENTDTAWIILKDFAIPRVLGQPLGSAAEAAERFEAIRGHRMATGGLEAALWDWEAKSKSIPLFQLIGGSQKEIPCGVSIGIQKNVKELLAKIRTELAAGYQRVKIKIKPGWDVAVLERVRKEFPRLRLMADANSAYTLADRAHLKTLDRFYLMMLEQPLAHDDLIDHARLQQWLETPICLDESIRTVRHAEQAIETNACRIINIKLGRVGGFTPAKQIHDYCLAAKIPVWCGGMLESGIGRAHNIALSTLPGFVLPGDVAASKRYWQQDVIQPEVEVTSEGTIRVTEGSGIGYEVSLERIEQLTVRKEIYS